MNGELAFIEMEPYFDICAVELGFCLTKGSHNYQSVLCGVFLKYMETYIHTSCMSYPKQTQQIYPKISSNSLFYLLM